MPDIVRRQIESTGLFIWGMLTRLWLLLPAFLLHPFDLADIEQLRVDASLVQAHLEFFHALHRRFGLTSLHTVLAKNV
ncbi:MAG: hypothetical protein IH989_02700 [Planctomycetes bacterium]|nr:hypothetical protein [Planctomycetota bacterium]